MKTASAKAKGRRLQKLVVAAILEHYTDLTEADVTPAIMGESGIDVKLSEAARRVFPYAVECKNVEKVNIWAAIKQAEDHAKQDKKACLRPLVVLLRNHGVPHVVLSLHDFFDIQTDAQRLSRVIDANRPGGLADPVSGAPGYAGDPPPGWNGKIS